MKLKIPASRLPLFLLAALALFTACSQAKPEIKRGSLELVVYENGGRPAERFTFFVLPADEDGIEDIEELWLYHDWEGLSWQLTVNDWISLTVNGQLWIGSRAISMDDGSPLPRGQYRAVLIDKSGDRSERSFTFDVAELPPFPRFTVSGNRYQVVSEYPMWNLIAYDNEGNYLITVQLSASEGDVTALGLPVQARSAALWAQDLERSVSALTDIVPLYD